jgi:hypothetical protein
MVLCAISGFRRDVDEICRLLSVASRRVKNMGPIGGHETSVQNHHSTLRDVSEVRSSEMAL